MNATSTQLDHMKGYQRGELAATETYQQAMAKLGDNPCCGELRKIHAEHREAANTFREHIRQAGGTPETGSGAWGAWAKVVEGTAKIFGKSAALKALKEGEEYGIRDYEQALTEDDCHPACREYIRNTLLPRQRAHVQTINRMMEEK